MNQKTILLFAVAAGVALVLAACQATSPQNAPANADTQGAAASTSAPPPGAADPSGVAGAADSFGNDLNQLDPNGSITDMNITASDLDLGLQ